ncbi:oxygenase MpaB family protein [Nannocystis sp. ILAH1]|uniref:oxygenase MpaB family protein n=1 Tax=Nannocystis sp. ILAH1 TaxID=2996789 RepID=UPI00226FB677|nr:oxygenase MpaB family protein [Nannocystis sp. ILAH1]
MLEPFRGMGEPGADAVIHKIFADNEVETVNQILKSIQSNTQIVPAEMPDAVEDYLNQTDDWPAWADPDKVRLGERLFQRYGMQMTLAYFTWSLPCCYAWAKAAKVLTWTGGIDKNVHRRIIETAQFVLDVMAEGGLEPKGFGVRTAQKIRLLHATIRYHVGRDPKWRASEWGTPANQEDHVATLLTLALVPRVLTKLGMDFSRDEEDAYFHCWRVIGHYLGIHEALLPRDLEDAEQLWEAIQQRQVRPSEDGVALTTALVEYLKLRIPGTMMDGIAVATIRELCSPAVTEAIGLERTDWTQHLMKPLRWMFYLSDETQDRAGFVAKISASLSRKLLEGLHTSETGGGRVTFRIPRSLQESWNLGGS